MSNELCLIGKQLLTDIANAIRSKTGKTALIYPKDMDTEILSIDTEAHLPITVNITQSEHQTIEVTPSYAPSLTSTTSNKTVSAPSGIVLNATVIPESGYTAGTLNQTQTTASWGSTVSFSATAATENKTYTITLNHDDTSMQDLYAAIDRDLSVYYHSPTSFTVREGDDVHVNLVLLYEYSNSYLPGSITDNGYNTENTTVYISDIHEDHTIGATSATLAPATGGPIKVLVINGTPFTFTVVCSDGEALSDGDIKTIDTTVYSEPVYITNVTLKGVSSALMSPDILVTEEYSDGKDDRILPYAIHMDSYSQLPFTKEAYSYDHICEYEISITGNGTQATTLFNNSSTPIYITREENWEQYTFNNLSFTNTNDNTNIVIESLRIYKGPIEESLTVPSGNTLNGTSPETIISENREEEYDTVSYFNGESDLYRINANSQLDYPLIGDNDPAYAVLTYRRYYTTWNTGTTSDLPIYIKFTKFGTTFKASLQYSSASIPLTDTCTRFYGHGILYTGSSDGLETGVKIFTL